MEKATHFPSKHTLLNLNRPHFPTGIATCFLFLPAYTLSTRKEVCALTVYVDAVAVLNFLINYLLLYAANRLGAAGAQRRRLALGAALGAVYAVAVYLPGLAFLRGFPCKLLCAAGMILASFGLRKAALRLGAVFFGVTLALCGAVYGVELLRGSSVRVLAGNHLFFPVSFFSLLLTAAAVALACTLLLPRLTHTVGSIVPVKLCLKGRCVRLSALRDSGNTLCDPVSGAPVLTVYWKAARGLLPPELALCQQSFDAPANLLPLLRDCSARLIPYRAVGISSGMLLAFPCEITLDSKHSTGLVALSPTPVSDGGAYDALTGGT